MALILLLLVSLALVIFLVLVFLPLLLAPILLVGAICYVVANFTTFIALPLLIPLLVLVIIALLVFVATSHDFLEALDKHGNILIFLVGLSSSLVDSSIIFLLLLALIDLDLA